MMRSTLMTVMLALVGIAGAPSSWAQSQQAPTQPSTATYSDAELKSFAAAAVDIHRINSTYLPKLADASPDEQRQIESQASQETTRAVEKQGLTSDKYDEILTAAQSKPEVAKKVEQFLNETPPTPGTTPL
jgi:post-segregation antitoxin (ccd killing protein)